MSVKISSLNTASTIDSGDDINIAGNNPLTFSDWGGGWFMQDGTYIRSLNQKSIWLGDGVLASQGGLSVGYGGVLPTAGYAIIAGSVGIGTSSPNEKLTVNGKIYANPYHPAVISGGGAPYYGANITLASDIGATAGAVRIWSRYDGSGYAAMSFERATNSQSYGQDPQLLTYAESMRISGAGSILIGTTTDAGYKLDVNGTARFTSYIAAASGIFSQGYGETLQVYQTNATNNTTAIIRQTTAGGNGNQDIGLLVDIQGAADTDRIANFRYYDGSTYTSRMAIMRGGNVGIGTTSPSTTLDVRGSANFRGSTYYGVTLERTATGGNIYLYEGNSPKIYLQSADNIIFNNGYNFGIGTASPQKILDVVSGANNFVTVGADGLGVGQWAGIHFGYRENNALYRKSAIVFERTDNAGGGGNAAGKVYILNGPGSGAGSATLADAKLTIDEYGKVGIGTTSPAYTLDVNGTARVQGKSIFGNNVRIYPTSESWAEGLTFIMPTTATWGGLRWQRERVNTDGNWYIGFTALDSTDDLVFGANNGGSQINNIIRLTKAGLVGIGTASPNAPLDVTSATSSSSGIQQWSYNSSPGSYRLQLNTIVSSGLVKYSFDMLNAGASYNNTLVLTNGLVGIGTASPNYKLDVNGDIYNTNLTFPMTGYSTANSPRITNPMSIKLYDNYFNGIAGSDYGTVLDIYGRVGHVDSQIYMDASQTLYFRIASYASGWGSWKTILDNTNFSTYINLAAYLPLAGGTMTGNITYSPGDATNWYIRGAANGAVLRLRYSGGTTNRSGALAWVDNANNYSDILTWTDGNLNATVTLYGTSASFTGNVTAPTGYFGASLIKSTTQFEATVASGGFWNSSHDVRFYPSAGNIWNITGSTIGLTSFALRFLDSYNSGNTIKAQIFWTASNLGFFNDQNDWVIKANQGASYGGTLYGAWIATGSITASANSSISGAVNSAWGLQVENTGTTNANGLYVNIGASSTGVPFRVDKGGAALFDITNAGNATIKGNLTISGATISLNSSAADIFQKYNNGSKTVGWNLTTANLFRLYDYTNDLVILGFNATSQNLDIYSNTVTINRLTTSTATLIFNASTAGNIWQIEKSDANGLSFQKGGVQQFGINAAGQASFIGSLAVVGDYLSVGAYGLYSSTYTAYFRRNDVSSYGAWELVGAKGSYTGMFYNAPNLPHMMFNTTDGSGGLYYQTLSRWITYYHYTNNCLSIGGATSSASYRFYVNGDSRIVGTFNVSTLTTNGIVYSNGGNLTNTNPSDIRLKEDINPLQYGLKEVMALNPVTYKWKDGSNSGQRNTGLIAQDVQEIMPEYVKNISEDSEYLGLDSSAINIVLINAIKELKAEIEILKNK